MLFRASEQPSHLIPPPSLPHGRLLEKHTGLLAGRLRGQRAHQPALLELGQTTALLQREHKQLRLHCTEYCLACAVAQLGHATYCRAMFRYEPNAPVALVGGAGVVGQRLAPLLAKLEGRPLLIAGRSEERAAASLAAARAAGGEAQFAALDLSSPSQTRAVSAVVGLVNDPDDLLLMAAVRAGVPFVDITRWTARLAAALGRVLTVGPRAPVVLASGWMAGLLARVAALLAHEVGGAIEGVDGAVRYALDDASGPDSVAYMDRLWLPFEVTRAGKPFTVSPLTEVRRVAIAGQLTSVRRFDTPEQWSLPLTLGARSAAVRLGFDHESAGLGLALLARLGILRLFAAPRFRSLRHALLRDQGASARRGSLAAFRVDVVNSDGLARGLALSKADGQAALTAVGAWLSLRFALAQPSFAGVRFPEQDPDNASLVALVERCGVSVTRSSP